MKSVRCDIKAVIARSRDPKHETKSNKIRTRGRGSWAQGHSEGKDSVSSLRATFTPLVAGVRTVMDFLTIRVPKVNHFSANHSGVKTGTSTDQQRRNPEKDTTLWWQTYTVVQAKTGREQMITFSSCDVTEA